MLSNWTVSQFINRLNQGPWRYSSECGVVFASDSEEIDTFKISYHFTWKWNFFLTLTIKENCSENVKSLLKTTVLTPDEKNIYSFSNETIATGFEVCGLLSAMGLAPDKTLLMSSFKQIYIQQEKEHFDELLLNGETWEEREKRIKTEFMPLCSKGFDEGFEWQSIQSNSKLNSKLLQEKAKSFLQRNQGGEEKPVLLPDTFAFAALARRNLFTLRRSQSLPELSAKNPSP